MLENTLTQQLLKLDTRKREVRPAVESPEWWTTQIHSVADTVESLSYEEFHEFLRQKTDKIASVQYSEPPFAGKFYRFQEPVLNRSSGRLVESGPTGSLSSGSASTFVNR